VKRKVPKKLPDSILFKDMPPSIVKLHKQGRAELRNAARAEWMQEQKLTAMGPSQPTNRTQ
jgi:hypothetical protein